MLTGSDARKILSARIPGSTFVPPKRSGESNWCTTPPTPLGDNSEKRQKLSMDFNSPRIPASITTAVSSRINGTLPLTGNPTSEPMLLCTEHTPARYRIRIPQPSELLQSALQNSARRKLSQSSSTNCTSDQKKDSLKKVLLKRCVHPYDTLLRCPANRDEQYKKVFVGCVITQPYPISIDLCPRILPAAYIPQASGYYADFKIIEAMETPINHHADCGNYFCVSLYAQEPCYVAPTIL